MNALTNYMNISVSCDNEGISVKPNILNGINDISVSS